MRPQKGRTVRFTSEELQQVDEFLRRNSFLDFSSLTRVAIKAFIENPTLVITPVSELKKHTKSSKNRSRYHG